MVNQGVSITVEGCRGVNRGVSMTVEGSRVEPLDADAHGHRQKMHRGVEVASRLRRGGRRGGRRGCVEVASRFCVEASRPGLSEESDED